MTKPVEVLNFWSGIPAADALLQIGKTQTNTSCVPKFCYQFVISIAISIILLSVDIPLSGNCKILHKQKQGILVQSNVRV